jgi:hypothetical protein
MSFFALPACVSAKLAPATTSAAAERVAGPTPMGRPMHQAATNARLSQPRLRSGESMSLRNATMPAAWKISDVAGRYDGAASPTYGTCTSEPESAKRAANGMWYQSVSNSSMPFLRAVRV